MDYNMEKTFVGLRTFSDKEKKEMIANSLIVLDTNILLNIYRCSENASVNFLNAISLKSENLWLPYFAGVEFYKDKKIVCREVLENISSSKEAFCNKTKKNIDDLKNLFKNYKDEAEYKKLFDSIDEEYKKIKENIDVFCKLKVKELNESFKNKDESILNLIGNNITPKLQEEELNRVLKEGEFRMEKGISPGFKDNKKDDYINGIKVNGDYIIWESVITLSKDKNRDVILLTNDLKSDYYDSKNKKINFELQREFFYRTNHSIILLSFDEFIRIYNSTIKVKEEKITKETKDELIKLNKCSHNILNENINYNINKFQDLFDKNNLFKEVKLDGSFNSLKQLSFINNDSIVNNLGNQLKNISDTLDKLKFENPLLYNCFVKGINDEEIE